MKRVRAWCGRQLDRSDRREDLQVTHGVCQVCRRRFFASRRRRKPIPSPPGKLWVMTPAGPDASSVGNEANRLMKTSTVRLDVSPAGV